TLPPIACVENGVKAWAVARARRQNERYVKLKTENRTLNTQHLSGGNRGETIYSGTVCPESPLSAKPVCRRSRSAGSKRWAAVSSASAGWFLLVLSRMLSALGLSASASMSIWNLSINDHNRHGSRREGGVNTRVL